VRIVAGLFAIAFLVVANGFFVAAEFAYVAVERTALENAAAGGDKVAGRAVGVLRRLSFMLSGAQLGITATSLLVGFIAEPVSRAALGPLLDAVGVPAGSRPAVSVVVGFLLVTFGQMIVAELVPKNLAIAGPERAALLLAPPLVWIAHALSPLINVLNGVANALLRAFGVTPKDEVTSTFTAQEVHSIVTVSRREGLLGDEHELVVGALEFSDRDAGDVAVPISSLVCVADGATPADVERLVARTGFSRFPVQDAAGDLSGYLHLKDVLYADDDRHEQRVPAKRIRSLVTVTASDDVEEVLAAMQRSGAHLARVVDATGSVSGVVFLEDVLEELVGEVLDENRRGTQRRA